MCVDLLVWTSVETKCTSVTDRTIFCLLVGSIIQLNIFEVLMELNIFLSTNREFKMHHLHLVHVKYSNEQGLPTSFK